MTSEGYPIHQRKRGPGRCEICGERWTDRFVNARDCGKQNRYYLRVKAGRRT